jgi:hypothetical protein
MVLWPQLFRERRMADIGGKISVFMKPRSHHKFAIVGASWVDWFFLGEAAWFSVGGVVRSRCWPWLPPYIEVSDLARLYSVSC